MCVDVASGRGRGVCVRYTEGDDAPRFYSHTRTSSASRSPSLSSGRVQVFFFVVTSCPLPMQTTMPLMPSGPAPGMPTGVQWGPAVQQAPGVIAREREGEAAVKQAPLSA